MDTTLTNLRGQHVDVLVYILHDMAIPDFMIDHVRTINLFQSNVLSKAEKIRKRLAYMQNLCWVGFFKW
jgi:hypothetical protein